MEIDLRNRFVRWELVARKLISASLLFGCISHLSAEAQASQVKVVFIECTISAEGGQNKITRGSGVYIGSGRILTAKHVGEVGICRASLEEGVVPNRSLVRGRQSNSYDAMIFRFAGDTASEPDVGFSRTRQGDRIVALGIPFDSAGQQIVRHSGEISSSIPDPQGLHRTTARMVRGMSGGPVIDLTSGALLGIVAGASFDPTNGSVTSYGMLDLEQVGTELGIHPTSSRDTSHTASSQTQVNSASGVEAGIAYADRLYGTGEYAKALAAYGQSCEAGAARACFESARMYDFADDQDFPFAGKVSVDFGKALENYQIACDQRNFVACTNLAFMHSNGRGTRTNDVEARRLYQFACDNGYTRACGNLGNLIYYGYGGERNQADGVALVLKACMSRHKWSCDWIRSNVQVSDDIDLPL